MSVETDLATVAIHFLKQFDPSDYNKYYMKDVRCRFNTFVKEFNKSHPPHSFTSSQVMKYLTKKQYVFFTNGQMSIKPLFISTDGGQIIIFLLNGASGASLEYYVCRLCDRGFSSANGLNNHRSSPPHMGVFNSLCEKAEQFKHPDTGKYKCPTVGCPNGIFLEKEELIKHLRSEKSVKVRIPSQTDQERQESAEKKNTLTCRLCRIVCSSQMSYNQHVKGWKHRVNDFRRFYYNNRPAMLGERDGIKIFMTCKNSETNIKDGYFEVYGPKSTPTIVEVEILNEFKAPLPVHSVDQISFFDHRIVSLKQRAYGNNGYGFKIPSGGKCVFDLKIKPMYYGVLKVPIIFTFSDPVAAGAPSIVMAREVVFICSSDVKLYKDLGPISPYRKPSRKQADNTVVDIVRSDQKPMFEKSFDLKMVLNLQQYPIPKSLKCSLGLLSRPRKGRNNHTAEDFQKECNLVELADLDFSNYSLHFNSLLHIEECQMEVDIESYSMPAATMRKDARTGLLKLDIPGLSENRPSVLKGDKLYALKNGQVKQFEGYVHKVERDSVDLGFWKQFSESYINNEKVTIRFSVNRLGIKLEHRAVTWAGEDTESWKNIFSLQHVLFPNPKIGLPSCNPTAVPIVCFNRDIESNPEQMTAIRHIVCGTSRPAPYLVFGPPGTGKTCTFVEAIKQVYKCFPEAKILACAPQNAAADLLTERLIKDCIDRRDILRLNAVSRSYGDITAKIKEVSNFRSRSGVATPLKHALSTGDRADMEIYFPSKEELMKKRVLVTTLVSAGRLVSADMSKHFTHIFIDEAGHASEPETLIAIAGLLDVNLPTGGQLVLAGDPKQLGPVIRSELAKKFGLGRSMLERLMQTGEPYQRHETGSYNPRFVTKLLKSFRSHPTILEIPNMAFYDGELIACADKMKREMFCNWEGLPRKGFPIVFHGVCGREVREASNPSWFNPDEIMVVINYIDQLMESKAPRVRADMIGVITPYHQQVVKIQRALKELETKKSGRERNYSAIKVGSVEKFQGDEREIIIITTVRTQDAYLVEDEKFSLGFITNNKRFNVAVTRAKALLIIVGNPDILKRCDCWKSLINHIEEGGGHVGVTAPDEVDGDLMEDLTRKINKIQITEEPSELQQQVNPEWQRRD